MKPTIRKQQGLRIFKI